VEFALAPFEATLASEVPQLAGRTIEADLVRARLADAYRDAQLEPVPADSFAALTADLDGEAWRRLALAVGVLDVPMVRAALPGLVDEGGVARQVEEAFVGLARVTSLLTMELLQQGSFRVEEFARHFLARLGAAVAGETTQQSRDRLERLDYARLLAEAERAKVSAEDRMEYLRKLQEEQDKCRPGRGKW
jgi:hypothetical protein